jgi:hypothetical protein
MAGRLGMERMPSARSWHACGSLVLSNTVCRGVQQVSRNRHSGRRIAGAACSGDGEDRSGPGRMSTAGTEGRTAGGHDAYASGRGPAGDSRAASLYRGQGRGRRWRLWRPKRLGWNLDGEIKIRGQGERSAAQRETAGTALCKHSEGRPTGDAQRSRNPPTTHGDRCDRGAVDPLGR